MAWTCFQLASHSPVFLFRVVWVEAPTEMAVECFKLIFLRNPRARVIGMKADFLIWEAPSIVGSTLVEEYLVLDKNLLCAMIGIAGDAKLVH